MEFESRYTINEDNNSAIILETIPKMDPNSKHTVVKYNWLRQNVVKKLVIQNIESKNHKADHLTKYLQYGLFVRIRRLICIW